MAHKQVVEGFFAALPTGHVPDALIRDDLVAWTPTSGEGSRARFLGGIAVFAKLFAGDFTYHIDRLVEEGEAVAVECRSSGTFVDGEPYHQTHMFAFDLVEGRIARIAEHMNTLITTEQVVPRIQRLLAKP